MKLGGFTIRRGGIVAGIAAGLVLAASQAHAATFEPTRLDDPAPNRCKPGNCSLREAVLAANDRNGRDKILLGDGTYRMQLAPELGNEGGQFAVFDALVLRGLGPRETRIDANGLDRVFLLDALDGKTALQGLTIKGGDASANPNHTNEGGGLATFSETTMLKDVVVKRNEAQFGGGISAASPRLTITASTLSQNEGQEGGGIDIRAALPQNTLAIRSSTISDNQATNGGGIMADGTKNPPTEISPLVTIDNSTIAGNRALASAGGMAAGQNTIAVLRHTTVAYNAADVDGTGGGAGGGLHQQNNAPFQFNDSVLALNFAGDSGTDYECFGTFEDGGSVVYDEPGSNPNCEWEGLFDPLFTNSPLIGQLEQNGGPTRTIRLLAKSPAIDAALSCPNRDQRGKPRPDEGCDAGAFERKGA